MKSAHKKAVASKVIVYVILIIVAALMIIPVFVDALRFHKK